MKVKLKVTNADLKIGGVRINSIASSSIVIFGDAESFRPESISITRGLQTTQPVPITGGGGGPTGAIR